MRPSQATITFHFDDATRAYVDEVVRLSKRSLEDVVNVMLAMAVIKARAYETD